MKLFHLKTPASRPLGLLKACLLALAAGIAAPAAAQTRIDWQQLAGVQFDRPAGERNPVYGKPRFSPEVQALDGQLLEIRGYMLPLTADNKLYILSRYPYTSCFFCGGGGKETVIELRLKRPMAFDVDEQTVIRGVLHLNDRPEELSFILEEAEAIP
ncbi:MAG: hypothetical protein OHK0039_19940 [Bacteroidia bacterium]